MTTADATPQVRTIDDVLLLARQRLQRLSPFDAYDEADRGALIVDIRPQHNQAFEGYIPGALLVERNVLEWRFDPSSPARLPCARYDLRVILVCNEGFTSSLAAAALQDLGVSAATDIVGGFRAWRHEGLPVSLTSTGG